MRTRQSVSNVTSTLEHFVSLFLSSFVFVNWNINVNLILFLFSKGSELIAPTSFYNAIASEEDYIGSLQHSGPGAANTIMTSTGPISVVSAPNGTMQFQTINNDGTLTTNTMYGTVSDLHHHHHHQPYMIGADMTTMLSVSFDFHLQTHKHYSFSIHSFQVLFCKGFSQCRKHYKDIFSKT